MKPLNMNFQNWRIRLTNANYEVRHVYSDVYIVYHFYFPETLPVKKLMETTYSETAQNMSEKQPDYVALANEVRNSCDE